MLVCFLVVALHIGLILDILVVVGIAVCTLSGSGYGFWGELAVCGCFDLLILRVYLWVLILF